MPNTPWPRDEHVQRDDRLVGSYFHRALRAGFTLVSLDSQRMWLFKRHQSRETQGAIVSIRIVGATLDHDTLRGSGRIESDGG